MSFKKQLESDIDVFYDTDEFGVTALYNGAEISVIFTDQFEVQSEQHKMITVRSVDVPNITLGETLEINGITYTIDNFEFKDETQLERVVSIWSE
jgi:hypothetical protein